MLELLCHNQECLVVWCRLQDLTPLLYGRLPVERGRALDSNGGFTNLHISQINFVERVLIERAPQSLCQLDRPVLYLVCWKHAVHKRPLGVLGVSP
jgi:hypothetical protein